MSSSDAPANVFTIAASLPFAETLARGLVERLGADRDPVALSRVTIYLPTRRAARSFAEVFAKVLGGAALLPEFRPLGDVDEDEFLFDPQSQEIDLEPAIAPMRRRLLLAALVKRWDETRRGSRLGFAQASALAAGLARLMDELETQEADLAELDALVPKSLAAHWGEVEGFLKLLDEEWPKILKDEGAANPARRRNGMLRALAERLMHVPSPGPVIAAGSTGSIPATGELLGVIARLPEGMVVLPGLDRDLDDDSWRDLDPGHPQYGMKQLLGRIGVSRGDVRDFGPAATRTLREDLLREALRPAPTTDAWRALAERGSDRIAGGLEGLSLFEAADAAEEAAVVALALRETLETPGRTAALVTPDRGLARRVASELERWNIAIDDSAGQTLSHTPPGTFLCLVAEAASSGFAPAPLLGLLKHPLATMGGDAARFREMARELDRALRGIRPDHGLDGVRRKIAPASPGLRGWFARVAKVLRPLGDALDAREIDIAATARLHLAAAEALSSPETLWRGDAGEKAAILFERIEEAARGIPAIEAGAYAPLFRALADEISVRPVAGRHPRLAILGAQEARLQSFDVVILGGLNEGTWPRAAAIDPWFSRPMRKAIGLEPPERAFGLAAHDFATLACAPRVLLTRAEKSEGTPAVASRWLQRLVQLVNGLDLAERLRPPTDYLAIHRALNQPERFSPVDPPAPKPPVALRPRSLSVTEIEKWIRDPYAIYARHVLQLTPLDPLDQEIGPLQRGTAIHRALERFVAEFPGELPPDAALRLIEIADEQFRAFPKAVVAVWRPRFINAAHWFVETERQRRTNILRSHLEIRGERTFQAPGGDFVLRGTADRIDELVGGGAAILDYKTGQPPTGAQVRQGLAPQLPLEAAILAKGGFPGVPAMDASALVYVKITGGAPPGEVRSLELDVTSTAAEAAERLTRLIALFDDSSTPYLSRVKPFHSRLAGDYDHLARVREWSLGGQGDDE